MKKSIYAIASLLIFFTVSCDSISSNKLRDMAGLEEANQILTSEFADKDFVSVQFTTKDALDDGFDKVYVEYEDKTIEKVVDQSFLKSIRNVSDPKPTAIQPKKYETFKQSEIDLAFTNQKTTEALKAITEKEGAEYKSFSLTDINYKKVNGKLTQYFNVTMTKIGAGSTKQGRNYVTDYYEIEATVKADGTIDYKDN